MYPDLDLKGQWIRILIQEDQKCEKKNPGIPWFEELEVVSGGVEKSLGACKSKKKIFEETIGKKTDFVVSGVVDPHSFQWGSGSRFYLNTDPGSGSQTNVDPESDPGQTLNKKLTFFHEKWIKRR